MMAGTLYGVGLGPGDPELVTVKAARLIRDADVIAYHSARHGRSIARSIAQPYLRGDQIEEQLIYPVTTESVDHPDGYDAAMEEFYEHAAARLLDHLASGRDVVLLAEGDPLFYSSYMHMHKRIDGRFKTVIVPGVTSVSAASAALATPLVERDDVLVVLPATLGRAELSSRLRNADAAAVMKISRNFGEVRAALADVGRLEDAHYIERATGSAQRTRPISEIDDTDVPYMSIVIVPGTRAISRPRTSAHPAHDGQISADASGESSAGPGRSFAASGRVDVVGLGPAGRDWLTPQAMAALSAADDIVGYGPYVARVPANPRQQRHASDNRVEAERAEYALELALRGRRVAVVSSGDPGVFAMAAAVLEVAGRDLRFAELDIDVLPGVTAAQAVASQVGAPLGHDYVVMSLSDRLKPWSVIEKRLEAAAAADFVVAIYNPASRSRRTQLADARKLLLKCRSPLTPVIIGRAVGTEAQQIILTTLGELDPDLVDMQCLLIVGSSQTHLVQAGRGPARVITPRRYPEQDDHVPTGGQQPRS
jgi:precorrin-2 C20-methyltransferase / precorrin-3B C17-methyltransferase